MQQTAKYKFNQPTIDDLISPTPLNENMDKVEAALEGLNGQVTATNNRVTATDNRVTAANNQITATGNRVTTAENRITATENGIVAANNRITTVDGRVTAVDGRVTAVDGRVTAVDGRRVLDHLLTATAPEGASEFTVNLAPFNPSQYGALVLVYAGEEGTQPMKMRVNGLTTATVSLTVSIGSTSIYTRYTACGFAFLIPCLERTFNVAVCGGALGNANGYTSGGLLPVPWRDITSLLITPVGTYARVSIYGLRI